MDERDRQDATEALELLDQIAARAGERFGDDCGDGVRLQQPLRQGVPPPQPHPGHLEDRRRDQDSAEKANPTHSE
jgi:hypothetical protein